MRVMSTRPLWKTIEQVVFLVLGVLLLISVFGGREVLSRFGLGFLGRWGAWLLWLGFLFARSLEGRAHRSWIREWRWEWLLVAALALSLVLRWPMADVDLEHYVGPDEGEVVENTVEMMKTGDLHHRHPGYPGLLFYLHMAPATAHFLLAAARGEGRSIPELPRQGFYRAARRLTLLAGWAAALVVFLIGREGMGRGAAALAGALLALSPLALRESRVVNPDLLLMLFVAAGLGLCLRVLRDPRAASFAVAGVGVGLASAIKYTGAVLVVPYLLAWMLAGPPRRTMGRAAIGLGLSGLSFALTSPYTFLDLPSFLRGLTAHFGYYQASRMNVPGELSRIVMFSGLGIPAAAAALLGCLWVLGRLERQGLVLLSFPMAYFVLFSFFNRVYPRHALVLLPSFALLAGRMVKRGLETRHRLLRCVVVSGVLAIPLHDSIRLGLAARRATPAERARQWIEANIPAGSRILEDQFTPRLAPDLYAVHRLGVEERVFVGNYDWVLHSGYPPGLPLKGLRRVMRFGADESLGSAIDLYQVPEREVLMEVTLGRERTEAVLPAGALSYFGKGWYAPSPSAYGTVRLSRGEDSEIFFVLQPGERAPDLDAELRASGVTAEVPMEIRWELNGRPVTTIQIHGEEPEEFRVSIPGSFLRAGLNRLVLRYKETLRLNRRHREAAIGFLSLSLKER